jgi:cutinase
VQYPADATATSVSTGSNDTVQRLVAQDKACPDQKYALVGYSQGAGVMRRAATAIPLNIQQTKILALVMFGDPGMKNPTRGQFPPVLQAKLFENCAVGDPVSLSFLE